MVPPPGSYSFGPHNGRILVKAYREGLARAVGHDLVIEVGEWSAEANVGEDPADTTITATAQVDSLNPIEGVGGVRPLTDADRNEIKKNIRKSLTSPEISFQSSSVKVKGSFSVLQTRWGIKPYTGLLGTLRVADRVDVEFEVDLPA